MLLCPTTDVDAVGDVFRTGPMVAGFRRVGGWPLSWPGLMTRRCRKLHYAP